jgi:shikimate dehydrogenase
MSQAMHDPATRYEGLLSGGAMVAGVIGHPIHHSLSPRLHGAWIRALGLDAAYVPLHTPPDAFEKTVRALTGGAFRGVNVTLPFKERALALADEATDRAKASGAANVMVCREDGTLLADNTDGEGLLYALRRQAPGWQAGRGPVTVIGAGGAARGAVAALAAAGATDIRVLNRTRARADTLSALLPCTAYGWDDAGAAFDGAVTVINATSGQLTGDAPLPLPPASDGGLVVMDMVYKPLETPFLAACHALGHQTVDGLDMLIGQAIPAFTAFYGVAPPDLPVREILLEAMVPITGGKS